MLPHADLVPFHDTVVWLWTCRTWRDDDADREASRIHDRFGVTSFPHLFVIDPRNDAVLVRAGRSTKALATAFQHGVETVAPPSERDQRAVQALKEALRALEQGPDTQAFGALEALERGADGVEVAYEAREHLHRLVNAPPPTPRQRLADPSPHQRVLALEAIPPEGSGSLRGVVAALLDDPDVLVRLRALRWLLTPRADGTVGDEPFARAESLLYRGNDPMRFALLDALAKAEKVETAPDLSALLAGVFVEAGSKLPSGNPNVLRGKAARVLARHGGLDSVDALATLARAANPNNGTTYAVLDALAAIGERSGDPGRDRVLSILAECWPPPHTKGSARRVLRLVQAVTDAVGQVAGREDLPNAPSSWGAEERMAHLEALEDVVGTDR